MSFDSQKSSDIKDNSFNYLCEKSAKWIENNLELIKEAKYDRESFAKLIKQLSSDTNLKTGESVSVYGDINQYWGVDCRFAVTCDDVNFLSPIWECDPFDDSY